MDEVTAEQEVSQVRMHQPHVVILGAGASRAAFPNGERNGHKLPLMSDFLRIVLVAPVLEGIGIDYTRENFEQVYALLANDPAQRDVRDQLESVVHAYFSSLQLLEGPTLPMLRGKLPLLLFLHGNVLAGYCRQDNVHGVRGARCSQCGKPLLPSKLLYPIAEKNYDQDPMIADAWRALREALRTAFMVTVFGYSTPNSDAAAAGLLQGAWGSPQQRPLEQFEIIDVRPEEELVESWRGFIHTHHYEVHSDAYNSWMFNHPRRTGEAFMNQYLEASFIEDNPIPRDLPFDELWSWFRPLLESEDAAV